MRARVRGGGLTQRGTSWPRERVCARGWDSKELWKSVEKSEALSFRRAREKVSGAHDRKEFVVFPVKYLASSLNST
jgi:hypothetical protein